MNEMRRGVEEEEVRAGLKIIKKNLPKVCVCGEGKKKPPRMGLERFLRVVLHGGGCVVRMPEDAFGLFYFRGLMGITTTKRRRSKACCSGLRPHWE